MASRRAGGPGQGGTSTPGETEPLTDPSGRPLPPHVTMGLLNYVTSHSLDEDYEHRAEQRRAVGGPASGTRRRAYIVAALGLAAFGLLVATAAVQSARNEPVRQQSRESLVAQVRDLRAELASAQGSAADLRAEVEAVRAAALESSGEGRKVSERLTTLRTSTGAGAVSGPGVEITVDDSPPDAASQEFVLDTDLQILVNGLWLSGAEAISINDQRLSNLTAIRIAGDAITVNFRSMSRPYVIRAIGDPDTLPARFIESAGGEWWLNLKSIYGLQFTMSDEESLSVPAAPDFNLRNARTAGTDR